MSELAHGQKRGHWIWWVFPTLAQRGGDMFSATTGADLVNVGQARAYAAHTELRASLIDAYQAADLAMAKHSSQAPWRVFDKGFGRSAEGEWVNGPVDSFKVWCSCTLFAVLAHEAADDELRTAAVAVLSHFSGDVVYSSEGDGTSGHLEGRASRFVLQGADQVTLDTIGGVEWSDVLRATDPAANKSEL